MGRMERVNELMKREIGMIVLKDLQDPRFQFVSITSVIVSPDFEDARVRFSFLGDPAQAGKIQEALTRAGGIVRRLVSQRMELRHTPRLEFVYDPSLEYSAGVEGILEEIKRDMDGGDGEKDFGEEEEGTI